MSGGFSGHHHTDVAKVRMSQARRGVPKSPETRAKMSVASRGRKLSSEARLKISLARQLLFPPKPVCPCGVCGKPTQRKYCGLPCYRKASKGRGKVRMVFACAQCGDRYEKTPSWASVTRFCSRKCADLSRQVLTEQSCVRCGQVFRQKDAGQKYCSRACYIRPKPIAACEVCGKDFRVGHVNQKGRFCSVRCRSQFQVGKNNPNFKGAPRVRFGCDWKEARSQTVRRDKARCRRCGRGPLRGRALNVHHRVPFRIVQKHETGNLVVLCTPCHRAVEISLPFSRRQENRNAW